MSEVNWAERLEFVIRGAWGRRHTTWGRDTSACPAGETAPLVWKYTFRRPLMPLRVACALFNSVNGDDFCGVPREHVYVAGVSWGTDDGEAMSVRLVIRDPPWTHIRAQDGEWQRLVDLKGRPLFASQDLDALLADYPEMT